MGFRSYFYGVAALVGVALASPADAQERIEEQCPHLFSDIHVVENPIPPNPFDLRPPLNPFVDRYTLADNPFCLEEDLDTWREEIDLALDTQLTLYDPMQLYPRWQRSASITSHRMEIPNLVHLNLDDEQVEFANVIIGTGSTEQTWRLTSLRNYFRQFTEQNITVRDGSMVYTLEDFLTTAQTEIPQIIPVMTNLISDLWTDVRGIFEDDNPLIALDFNLFFTNLLPRYTNDGVITPEEAQDIAQRTQRKIEQVYDRSLTDEERTALNEAINDFTDGTNSLFNRIQIDNMLQPLLTNPWGTVFFGSNALQRYREMGEDVLSILDVTIRDNTLSAQLHAYATLVGQSDYVSTYFFHTDRGDYFLRHGILNYTSFLSEGHLRIDAEFHGGRPLSDFAGQLDQDAINAITQVEQLLGYRPVTIDASIEASLRANVLFENFIQDTYEATLVRGNFRYGIGNSHGFVYRFNLDLDSGLSARIDSFAYQIETHFHLDLVMREESGRQVLSYGFVQGRHHPAWFGISVGSLWESLIVRDRQHHIRFDVVSDFEGNMEQSTVDEQTDRTFLEQRLRPIYSGVIGFDVGPVGMFATVRDESMGAGLYLVTSHLTMEGRVDDTGSVHVESIGALSGHIDVDEARSFHRDRLIEQFSLFPARRAAVWDMTNRYLTRAMHGFFVESSFDLNFIEQPHAGPMIARFGLLFAGDAYIRLGVQGTPDFRTYGTYAGGGNDIFGLTAMLLQEQTYGRDSRATSVTVQSHLNIGAMSLHLGATGAMVSPEVAQFLGYGEEEFGYTYTLTLEGIL